MQRAHLAHRGEELGLGRNQVHVAGHRLDDDAGNLLDVLEKGVLQALGIVVVEYQGVPRQIGRNPGR